MTRTEFSYNTRSMPARNGQSRDQASTTMLSPLNSEIVSMFPADDLAGVLIDLPDTIVTTVDDLSTPEMNASSTSAEDSADLRNAAERIWRRCLDAIRPQLSAQTMRTWFEPLEATALEGTEITLRAPSSFFCEWIG